MTTALGHIEQIATYYDRGLDQDVLELRCTVCRVLVSKVAARRMYDAAAQREIREAWARHATPPAEGDFQI